jgi:beta-phosphoglucomutase family hydrolase
LTKKAVIFDLDGTLIDSHESHIEAFKNVLSKYGIPVESDDVRPRFGKKGAEIIREIADEKGVEYLSEEKIKAITDEKQEEYRRIAKIIPLPGSVELIEKINSLGVPIAIATATSRENAELAVQKLAIGKFIKKIITGDDVKVAKPAPDIFLITARKLGHRAGDCIVFEDSLNGVKAAKAAGMKCVAVSTGEFSKEELEKEGCLSFNNLSEVAPRIKEILS